MPAQLPPLPRLIAHRCGGVLAPENTLAGLHAAAARGFSAVEFDVMLSADGTPVLIHDETLERTTNGIGRVCETPDAVLFSLDAGQGERIPTLAEAAALCQQYGFLANVEIKPAAGHEARTAEVVARFVVEHWGFGVPPLISSFSPEALATAKRIAPQLQYGLLYESVPADWLQQRANFGALTLHCAACELSDVVLKEAEAAGVPVLCYTVNDPGEAQALFARGVASVFTDRLDLFA
ncbi:MAG: glycerophosphoryl diester phosphodiesterase [Pseudomonadota bacterium]|nr:glycerophosphoryl diester phosphodiesterase [Pseudomonadota bacterium]MDQ5914120.1 glycerophosphoryl diester phosphodiesterase [Pseudomonadota bacterium]